MFGALNTDEKDLLCEYYDRLLKCLESVQRTTDAEFCVLLIKENGISRDFISDIYIPPPNRTWENLWHWDRPAIFLIMVTEAE